MPADLLFEIGCEEVPAKMLARALAELPALTEARLTAARLDHAGVRALGTPRRLAVIVKALADRQPDLDEEVVGPPVSAAVGADGSLTKAGLGFAAKNGVEPSALVHKEVAGKKGRYVVAQRKVVGQDARALLPGLLAELAGAIPWPKSQRWGWGETAFVRPVQWLVALFGGEVVPLTWAGVTSRRASRGHRFLSPGPVELASPDQYVEALRAAHVVVDPAARRELVRAELARLEEAARLKVRPDEALLDEVIHLGEYPVGIAGAFDSDYLEIPEEMIVTAMRTHQRYFAMERSDGTLANRFATMMATIVKSPSVVGQGNETVLAARLADAKFFFTEDCKKTFAEWNAKLDAVVFQAKLGDRAKTIGDKIRRIVAIVERLRGEPGAELGLDAGGDTAVEAARLCKADLASLAVGEFPELQGVMGRHYARHHELADEIGLAIEQHWWPKGQGAQLPQTAEAALIAIADRIDTIVGCFAVGLEPTGSADPFGLRRAAIGIWLILLDRGRGWARLWQPALDAAVAALADQGVTLADRAAVDDFFRTRLRGIFLDQGLPAQDVDAALARDLRDPIDARARATALGRLPKEAREVFKRVANILDDARAKQIAPAAKVDPARFSSSNPVEANLERAIREAREREAPLRAARDYSGVLDSLVQLHGVVAAFFDRGGVMVMDPDPELRANRLALLEELIAPYMAIGDFRLLGGAT